MTDWSDQQLLDEFSKNRSEAAFGELVRRHVDMTYSTALRLVGDTHLAKDVTQAVFLALGVQRRLFFPVGRNDCRWTAGTERGAGCAASGAGRLAASHRTQPRCANCPARSYSRLNWSALTGARYQLQYMTSLTQESWLNLGIPVSIPPITLTNSPGDRLQRFFRLKVLPGGIASLVTPRTASNHPDGISFHRPSIPSNLTSV